MRNIKTLFLISVFFAFGCTYAQNLTEDEAEKYSSQKSVVEFKFYGEIQLFNPTFFGEHFLNQAYEQSALGFGLYMNLLNYRKFNLGIGYSSFRSSLTDASLAGNFERSTYRTYFAQLNYEILKTNNFNAGISLGYGANYVRQFTRSARRGRYSTDEWRTGAYLIYEFTKTFNLSFRANYLTTNANIERPSQADDLFGRTHLMNLSLGFIFKFGN